MHSAYVLAKDKTKTAFFIFNILVLQLQFSYLSSECATDFGEEDYNRSTIEDSFRPKYKYYEELRDIRKDKYFVLKLRQSPGVRRRILANEGESRADSETANESKA